MQLFGLADCNNFFCSCERVFRPDLRNRPIVVLSNNDGCVIARSNEAKALGIKMCDPFFQIRKYLEQNDVAVFSSNYSLYGDMSRRVMSLLSGYTPRLDIYSIDEAFLDLSNLDVDIQEYGRGIVRLVSRGTGIPISLGVAPTKTLAKMASKFAKQYKAYRGVCVIDSEEKRQKALKLFDVSDVWGIGRRHAQKLIYRGINTAWDLSQKPSDWIRRELSVTGWRTWRELNGESCITLDELPHKQSICTSRSFPDAGLSKLKDMEEAVADFAAQCSRKLRSQHTVCQSITVFANTSRFRSDAPNNMICANLVLPVATNNLQEIVSASLRGLRQQWKREHFFYKNAGVIAWNITPDNAIQSDLFDTVDRDKQERLMKAVDAINRRNGHNTIRTSVQAFEHDWHLKREYVSRQYTTNLRDIIILHVN